MIAHLTRYQSRDHNMQASTRNKTVILLVSGIQVQRVVPYDHLRNAETWYYISVHNQEDWTLGLIPEVQYSSHKTIRGASQQIQFLRTL
jgi:hypothetical protein